MSTDDEAIARLRDADPAGDRETDLTSLRAAVDARTGTAAADAGGPEKPPASDELARRRAQRSRRHAWVAGVAASVLVGVAGYTAGMTVASGGVGGGDSADSAGGAAEPSVAFDGAGGDSGQSSLAGGAAQDSATEENAAGASDLMWGSSRAVFVASGLSGEAGSAEAFGYDPTGVASADTAAGLATALGIDGDAADQGGYWLVGDPAGRNVSVYDDGTASVSYSDPDLDPWACAVEGGEVDPDGGSDGFSGCATDGTGPADPIATATDFLTTIGVDLSGLELVVDYTDATSAGVSGYLPDVGRDMGGVWNLTVTDEGVYSAWGWLAPRTSLGDYDVISATDAVERLMDPRFGASNGITPLAAAETADSAGSVSGDTSVSSDAQQPTAPLAPVSPVEPGDPIAWPVTTYTITDAELTLSTYTLPDGAVVVLPTWSLTAADDGGTWTVVALTEAALDFEG